MRPPYQISPAILNYIIAVSEKLGETEAKYLNKQTPQLRKQNKIKTIHSSLKIEGNTLSEEQVTAIIENKRVIAPQKDIMEVINAIEVYEQLAKFRSFSSKSFLEAHKILMKGLIAENGKYRSGGVGIVQGKNVKHIAPSYKNVPALMNDLFEYLKKDAESILIKSCVFHYEMEFIHPFMDGNGRMGRLWQTVILLQGYPVFEFLPFETLISNNQKAYYKALAISDSQGSSTIFIEYMLGIIDQSLENLLNYKGRTLKEMDRLEYFLAHHKGAFTRKDYMNLFKEISSATASRDLKKGVEKGLVQKEGEKAGTVYRPCT